MNTKPRSGAFARWMARPSVSPAAVLWLMSTTGMWAHYGWRVGVATAMAAALIAAALASTTNQ